MKAPGKTSIKRRLTQISMMTTGLALLLMSGALITDELIAFRRSLVGSLTGKAKIIGSNSTAALLFDDRKAASENLASLRTSRHIVHAVMYAQDGMVFATYHRDKTLMKFIAPLVPSTQEEGHDFGMNRLSLFQPILFEGDPIGTIYMQSDLEELYSRLQWYGGMVIVVIGLSLFAAFLLVSRLQQAITKPLQDLVGLMQKVSAHKDYSVRSSTGTYDELDSLAEGLNEMLTQIQSRDAELEQHRDHLESEVAIRTEQLQQELAERKRAEEDLKNFAARLEKSNKELEEFAYVASHDLQEPLRKVTAFGEQLKTKYGKELGEKAGDYLERMQSAARRMQNLINNLLTYSRVTTKAQPFVPVDLGSVAQEVLSDLEVRIEQTNGRVDVGDLPTTDADPLQMRQLFQNLIGNALKFHRENEPPVVTIRSALITGSGTGGEQSGADGDLCRITVEDNGIGFEDKDADRVFGLFQRLHGRSEYEGTGIGLAICRKIVERHGGTITATSTPGQGATFIIGFPVKQPKGEQWISAENA